jgi:hypothetical protein
MIFKDPPKICLFRVSSEFKIQLVGRNIPSSPAYGVCISHLIQYAKAYLTYDQFLVRGSLLTNKLMSQGFLQSRLQATFRKFYVRYNDLVCPYNLPLDHMLSDVSYQSLSCSWHTDLDYYSYRLPNLEIGLTAGVTFGEGMLVPSRHLIPSLIYSEVLVCPFSDLYFLKDFWDWLLFVIYAIPFHGKSLSLKKKQKKNHLALDNRRIDRNWNVKIYKISCRSGESRIQVRIRVRISPQHPLVCR